MQIVFEKLYPNTTVNSAVGIFVMSARYLSLI